MIKFNRITISIASVCFALCLALYLLANEWLFNNNPGISQTVLLAVAVVGVYRFLFGGLMWVYFNYLHTMIHTEYDLNGKWYVVAEIDNEGEANSFRFGECNIICSVKDGIMLSGQNKRLDNSFSSSWTSESADILGRKLIMFFTSDGISRIHPVTRGMMMLNITGKKPDFLTGVWSDLAPHTNRGSAQFFKSKERFEEVLNSINTP